MKRFELTPDALNDVHDILDFISRDSFDAADRVLENFYRAFDQLADNPGIGHKRDDLTRQDVLFWGVYRYLVIYRRSSRPLLIVAVLHGSRDVKKILKKR